MTAWIFVVVVGIGLFADLLNDRPPLRLVLGEPLTFLGLLLGMWSVFTAMFYLTLRIWAWAVLPDGVRGRSYWGRRVHIRWDEVGRVYATNIEGIPVLGVESRDARHEAILYTMGVDLAEAHHAFLRQAGPDHLLTLAFAPRPAQMPRGN